VVKASENTNLHTEFLLQIWNNTDSAMLLASNKQHKEITEKHNRIDKTHRKGQQRRTKTKWGLQETPHLQDFIQNHSEYSKC
jgi:hypothetical protein